MRGGTSSWHPMIKGLCSRRNLENLLEVNTQTLKSWGAESKNIWGATMLSPGKGRRCGTQRRNGGGRGDQEVRLAGQRVSYAQGILVMITLCQCSRLPPVPQLSGKLPPGINTVQCCVRECSCGNGGRKNTEAVCQLSLADAGVLSQRQQMNM